MPIRRRLSHLQPFLVAWVVVIALGVAGTLIQFRQNHPLFSQEKNSAPFVQPSPVPTQPVLIPDLDTPPPNLSAREVWIFDRQSQSLIYDKNAENATSVASLAKLMTAYVAYENYNLDDTLTVGTASQVEGNKAGFFPTDMFTVRDLLKSLLVFSANDSAQTLAQGTQFGDESNFVAKMNEQANDLGLEKTHFANPIGLDDPAQYSSAADLGKLVDVFLHTPFFSQTVRQQTITVTELKTKRQDVIYTTNQMLAKGPQYTGVKTGTTEDAGESLIVRIENTWSLPESTDSQTTEPINKKVDQPVDIIIVILGSSDRYKDATALSAWLEQALRVRETPLS